MLTAREDRLLTRIIQTESEPHPTAQLLPQWGSDGAECGAEPSGRTFLRAPRPQRRVEGPEGADVCHALRLWPDVPLEATLSPCLTLFSIPKCTVG